MCREEVRRNRAQERLIFRTARGDKVTATVRGRAPPRIAIWNRIIGERTCRRRRTRGTGAGARRPRRPTLEARENLVVGDLVLLVLTNGQGEENPREKARIEVPGFDVVTRRLDEGAKESNGTRAGTTFKNIN